jgi:excisionase family DNA binding protein
MEQIFYSVKELSQILALHPKTVQRFIRQGKIKARKIGRAWKISQQDLKEYAHAELKPKDSLINQTNNRQTNPKITVSAVIEITNQNSEEASRISNSLIAVLNGKDPAWGKTRFDFIYQPETRKAKFILYGSPRFISAIMKTFDVILQPDNKE